MPQDEQQDVINMLVNESAQHLNRARQAELLVAKKDREIQILQTKITELTKPVEESKKAE